MYAPQSVKHFYDELTSEWDMHSVDYLSGCCIDINRDVCRHISGIDAVHRGYGVGRINLEGRISLMFSLGK